MPDGVRIDGPANFRGLGIPGQETQDPPRAVLGTHERPDSLAETGGAYQAGISQAGKGPPALPAAGDVTDSLRAVVLQLERPRHGGSALRGRVGQAVSSGLNLSEALPDETTILNFRHLLERHGLGKGLFEEINAHLESQGLRLREGTIVDASIIEAPSSTKNRNGERDPEMHQTKKGNQWHFGMKAHIGVDSETGIVHSMSTTAANAHDVTEAHGLLHGGETQVWGDAGYQGVHKRDENLGREVEWQVAMRPGKRRKLDPESPEAVAEKRKASVRAKVEHPFLKVKRVFDYAKVRYRELAKNTDRLALLFGLGNLLTAEGQLTG